MGTLPMIPLQINSIPPNTEEPHPSPQLSAYAPPPPIHILSTAGMKFTRRDRHPASHAAV